MIFRDGYMVKSGDPVNVYIDRCIRHILLKQVGLFVFLCLVFL